MSGNRRLRSFSRQRRSRRRIDGGVFGRERMPIRLFRDDERQRVRDGLSLEDALRPVSISHSTTPNAQTSARLSAAEPVACSGDMYAAVPRIMPARVAPSVSVGECVTLTS